MSKRANCPACQAKKKGVKSRIAFKHTCGKEKRKFNFPAHNQQKFGADFFHKPTQFEKSKKENC